MIKRFYEYNAVMSEIMSILGGVAERIDFVGKKEIYTRNNKIVTIERLWMFDDERGENIYDLRLES